VKNGFAASGTRKATMSLRPDPRWRAEAWGTNPVLAMAAPTRARVAGRTSSGWLRTFETVPDDTPAAAATSLMVIRAPAHRSIQRTPNVDLAHSYERRFDSFTLSTLGTSTSIMKSPS